MNTAAIVPATAIGQRTSAGVTATTKATTTMVRIPPATASGSGRRPRNAQPSAIEMGTATRSTTLPCAGAT